MQSAEDLFLFWPSGAWPLTPKQLERLARERIELTAVVVDGKVAGFSNLYGAEPGEFAFIGNVVVDPKLRGRGIGRELMRHMMALCRNYGPEARLSVFAENRPALLLYLSLGFRPYAATVLEDPSGAAVVQLEMAVRLD